MTLLYRSPNILIDKHEWHVTVNVTDRGHVSTVYKFRTLEPGSRWKPITEWPLSCLPLGMKENFRPYFASMRAAVRSVARRLEKRPRRYRIRDGETIRQARHEELAA